MVHNNEQSHKCANCAANPGGQVKGQYKCQVCSKIFKRWSNLIMHARVHSANSVFSCDVCGEGFSKLQEMATHRRGHTEQERNPNIKCETTPPSNDTSISTSNNENSHNYEFNICSKTIQKREQPTKLCSISEVKVDEVDIAGRADCADAHVLTQVKTRTEDINASTFVKAEQVERDKMRFLQKPNTCETCGKSFTQKSYLVVHKRIHTGEMPYGCDICGTVFRQRSHMVKHKQAIHKAEVSTLDKCKISSQAVLLPEHVADTSCTGVGNLNEDDTNGETCAKVKNWATSTNTHTGTINSPAQGDVQLVFEEQNSDDKLVKKPFECDVCHKKFRLKSYVSIHKRIHTGEMPYKCNICNRAFRQKPHVKQHKKTVHKLHGKTKTLDTNSYLNDVESESDTTACENFPSEYSMVGDPEIFSRHHTVSTSISEKTDVDDLKCDKNSCNGETSGTSNDKLYACDICNKAFTRKHYLAVHKRIHTGERPYECTVCFQKFRQDNHVRVHMARIHRNQLPAFSSKTSRKTKWTYKCGYCSKEYRRLHFLKLHKKIHEVQDLSKPPPSNDNKGKRFRCQFCSKAFKVKQHLNSHERVHTGVRPYVCKICGSAYKQPTHLTRHSKVHLKEQLSVNQGCVMEPTVEPHVFATSTKDVKSTEGLSYHESQCNSTTIDSETKRDRLKKKIFTVKISKPYECEECGKRFERKQTLQFHERIHTTEIHTEGKPAYECDECGKGFTKSGNLQRHKLTHTCQRPYGCENTTANDEFNLCDGTSTTGVNEVVENEKNPNGDVYRCCECGEVFDLASSMMKHCVEEH